MPFIPPLAEVLARGFSYLLILCYNMYKIIHLILSIMHLKDKLSNSRLLFLLIGILLAISVSGVWAAWNSTVSGGQTLTSSLWNDVVAKLTDLDTRTAALESGAGASINYSDCVTISHTEGGGCGSGNTWGTCPNDYVMIGVTTGLRYPGSCVEAQVRCCRLD